MTKIRKNVRISQKHEDWLKKYCEEHEVTEQSVMYSAIDHYMYFLIQREQETREYLEQKSEV